MLKAFPLRLNRECSLTLRLTGSLGYSCLVDLWWMIQDFSLSGAFRDGPIFWSVRQGALNGTIFYVNFVLGLSGNGQHALSCDYAETRHQFWMLGREKDFCSILFNSVQSLSHVQLFATPWVAAHQASLSITSSWSSPKLMCIESVMPFSHLILCSLSSCPQSLPESGSFPMSQLFAWGSQSTGVSALASFLPMNTQDWSHLGWTGWISLQSKGLSRVFSNTTVQKHQFFSTQLSSQFNSHIHTWPQEKP